MKLSQAIQEYVGLKQAMGSRFHAEAVILSSTLALFRVLKTGLRK